MKDELIRKIQDVLDRRITNEKQVVYLLVEIRKLMDRDKYNDPVLRTFSNWVVHTSLESRREGSTFILTEFDQWFIDLYERKKKSPHLKHISLVGGWATLTGKYDAGLFLVWTETTGGAPLLALFEKWPAEPPTPPRTQVINRVDERYHRCYHYVGMKFLPS